MDTPIPEGSILNVKDFRVHQYISGIRLGHHPTTLFLRYLHAQSSVFAPPLLGTEFEIGFELGLGLITTRKKAHTFLSLEKIMAELYAPPNLKYPRIESNRIND
jgi:hypothetical protein